MGKTNISNTAVNNTVNDQALVMATASFHRFVVTKKSEPIKTVVINGDINIDQQELGRTSRSSKAIKIMFDNLTITKQDNERSRVNGEVKIIAGEKTLEEIFKDFVKHF